MARKFVNVDRDTPLLLAADMREWVSPDDPVHLVLEAVQQMDLAAAACNERGTGSAQYPPSMMLALLIYCYGQGLYSSRRIESATYTHLPIRYLTGDTHPDHDTIATFRRANAALLHQAFVELLGLAREMGLPQLGTVCLDGTKLKANASARHNRRESQLREELAALQAEVAKRLGEAELADAQPCAVGQLPAELADRTTRLAKLQAARAAIQRRASEQKREPKESDLGNSTDPDSRLQPTAQGFVQGYNAQLAVSAESGLIVAAQVCDHNQDRQQLLPTIRAIPTAAGPLRHIVADTGYDHHEQIQAVAQQTGASVYIAPQEPVEVNTRQSRRRAVVSQERLARRERVRSACGRQMLRLRRCVVEPLFGTLKAAWGFTRLHLRGLAGVNLEWTLLCLAYNMRKLHRWSLAQAR